MFLLIAKGLGIWTLVAASTGFAMGAMIKGAEKLRKAESLAAIYACQANKRFVR